MKGLCKAYCFSKKIVCVCVCVSMSVSASAATLLLCMCVYAICPQEQCGSYTFIPYMVSPQGKVFASDASTMKGIQELMQPSFKLEPLLTPLVDRLVQMLENVQIHSRSVTKKQLCL